MSSEILAMFEQLLSVSAEDVEFEFRGMAAVPWTNFLLNPRRLRGSDFLMRWSQGVWSEKRLLDALNETREFYAIAYGPSGTAPTEDVRAYELYLERLEAAGLGRVKRPDLLIFREADHQEVQRLVAHFGGEHELPFIVEDELAELLDKAILAVECENSLWIAEKMPDFRAALTPQKRLNGKLGLKKNAVLPTIIIKEEDRTPLLTWQETHNIPIHVWHVFFDRAYGLALHDAERLVNDGLIQATIQTFQAPGGAVSKKLIYKFYYHYAYPVGISAEEPQLAAAHIVDQNGHILPYVRFQSGKLSLLPEALATLRAL